MAVGLGATPRTLATAHHHGAVGAPGCCGLQRCPTTTTGVSSRVSPFDDRRDPGGAPPPAAAAGGRGSSTAHGSGPVRTPPYRDTPSAGTGPPDGKSRGAGGVGVRAPRPAGSPRATRANPWAQADVEVHGTESRSRSAQWTVAPEVVVRPDPLLRGDHGRAGLRELPGEDGRRGDDLWRACRRCAGAVAAEQLRRHSRCVASAGAAAVRSQTIWLRAGSPRRRSRRWAAAFPE